MTCFWDGITRSMNNDDYVKLGITKHPNHIQNIKNIIAACKNKAPGHALRVLWQGKELTPKEVSETKEAIRDYNVSGIGGGHWTSVCDPFLCFFSSFLSHKIIFNYMNNQIIFEPVGNVVRKNIYYRANRGHFVFQKVENITN